MKRRWKEAVKLERRKRLTKALGLQQGSLYARHREKIEHSAGYMRDGNMRHYVACYPKQPIHQKGHREVF